MNISNRTRTIIIALLGVAAVTMLVAFTAHAAKKAIRGDVSDFLAYHTAAQALCQHSDPYVFAEKPYIYPPLFATLCMPLASLPISLAALCYVPVMALAILTAFMVGIREMMTRFHLQAQGLIFAACTLLAFFIMEDRAKSDLQMFQVNSLLLCLIVLALRWLDTRPSLAGAALGLAMNIKVFPFIFLPYLLFRRRWKTACSMLGSTVVFGLLPSLVIGWKTNLQYLAQSSGGFLTLLGVQAPVHQKAQIKDVTASYSVSIPSGMARMLGPDHLTLAWGLTGVLVVAVLVFGAWAYRRHGLARWRWPAFNAQQEAPWRAMVALEWCVLIAIALIFSPQTNTRHFMMLAPLAMLGSVLLAKTFRASGWTACLAGTALVWAGLTLPPGSFRIEILHQAHAFWQFIGGPGWILLLSLPLLVWGGAKAVKGLT